MDYTFLQNVSQNRIMNALTALLLTVRFRLIAKFAVFLFIFDFFIFLMLLFTISRYYINFINIRLSRVPIPISDQRISNPQYNWRCEWNWMFSLHANNCCKRSGLLQEWKWRHLLFGLQYFYAQNNTFIFCLI